jgi:TonB family protein
MSLNEYIDGAAHPRRRRPGPPVVSLLLHGAAFFALMNAPEIKLQEQSKSAYKQAIEGKETKLVWYKLNEDLPAVKPLDAKAESKPLRAEMKARQEIVASAKDAPKRTQMVWMPAPELKQTKPVELPNILAIRLPEMARAFVPPPEKKPPTAKIDLPADAPQLQPKLDAVKLADAQKIAKPFVPPPTKVPVKVAEVVAPSDAPQVEAKSNSPALDYSFKAPARPFTAPAVKAASTSGKQPTLETPPDLIANSRDLNLAVVGLNPSINPAMPTSSSPAQFSAGPKVRAEGADSAGDAKGITVPDLFIAAAKDGTRDGARDGSGNGKSDLIAQAFAAPTSPMSLRAAARLAEPRAASPSLPSLSKDDSPPPSHSGAVKVSSAPEKRFTGRDVYMMAIQMPNLTSYSGSWLMWYADRTARETGLAPVAPPEPRRKVDPKYVAAAAADRIEGKVQLACVIGKDGRVSTVELVRGLDDRLNQTAQEALAKWEFTPATRNGEPVEVDVLVEIPFRLAPRNPVRY